VTILDWRNTELVTPDDAQRDVQLGLITVVFHAAKLAFGVACPNAKRKSPTDATYWKPGHAPKPQQLHPNVGGVHCSYLITKEALLKAHRTRHGAELTQVSKADGIDIPFLVVRI